MIEHISPVRHASLCVREAFQYDDLSHQGMLSIVWVELADSAANFPIVFVKDSKTGGFVPAALCGFDQEQSLFVDKEGKWVGTHVPWRAACAPFTPIIGEKEHELGLDLNNSNLCHDGGVPLFDGEGNETRFVQDIRNKINALVLAERRSASIIELCLELKLISPLTVIVMSQGGQTAELQGLYSISSLLEELSDAHLKRLQQEGILAGLYLARYSLVQFKKLTQLKRAMTGETVSVELRQHA